MFGSEFDSHKRPHDDEETPSEGPADTYSDDGYPPHAPPDDEPRSSSEKAGHAGNPQRSQRPLAVSFLLFTAALLALALLAPRGYYTRGLRWAWPWPAATTTPAAVPPLDVFQVYPPVRVGAGYLPAPHAGSSSGGECSLVLMQHEFAWSYGRPFVGRYVPPECSWTHVLFNLTMSSRGRQFDRLGMLFLGDVEVFRTSTAEPTQAGIVFSYTKDMTAYTALLTQPQKIIFDLGNLVDSTYTGTFAATLTATFYTPPPLSASASPYTYRLTPDSPPLPAHHILPISTLSSAENNPSHFLLPADNATATHTLPRNTIHALVSLSASGNADEEFWYANVPTAYTHTFPGAPLPGASPFREVQLLVNGQLAGVAWPFAQIYTGGINPALWRPVVGIAAYDVPEYTVDITPLLPALLGAPCTFEIRVATRDPLEPPASNWIVSGRVFAWTDPDGAWATTGTIHGRHVGATAFTATTRLSADGANTTLHHRLTAQRALSLSATINTSSGPRPAAWSQGLTYESVNELGGGGATQRLRHHTRGSSASAGEHGAGTFSWPLHLNTTYLVDGAGRFVIWASIDRAVVSRGCGGGGVFPGCGGSMRTRVNGSAVYVGGGRPAGAWGETTQSMAWTGAPAHGEGVGAYGRVVSAERGRVVADEEWVNGVRVQGARVVEQAEGEGEAGWEWGFEGWGVRRFLGRGPA